MQEQYSESAMTYYEYWEMVFGFEKMNKVGVVYKLSTEYCTSRSCYGILLFRLTYKNEASYETVYEAFEQSLNRNIVGNIK